MKTKRCKNGHAMTQSNTYVYPKTGISECRACRNNNSIQYKVKSFFGGNREKAIQRDGEKCVKCGTTRAEHKAKYGRDITVDHIDGNGSTTPIEKKNNSLRNLQTLCSRCHGKKDVVKSSRVKLANEDAEDIRMFHSKGMRAVDIAKGYPMVHYQTILDILHRKSFRQTEEVGRR